jgi:hypothetical protein
MNRSSGLRKTAHLSESVRHQLNMYALAASAAGVGVVALAQPSEARIVYTPAHNTIKVHQHYNLDLNHDGMTDFALVLKTTRGESTSFDTLLALSPKENAVVGRGYSTRGRGPLAYALLGGVVIGRKQPFPGKLMAIAGAVVGFSVYAGQWLDRSWQRGHLKNRYLGLKFQIRGKTHYGWARLNVVSTHRSITSATLTGYAYETIPNKRIIAGKTKGPNDSTFNSDSLSGLDDPGPGAYLTNPILDTPQPASLGMLAVGAQGVPLWRRKETALETD